MSAASGGDYGPLAVAVFFLVVGVLQLTNPWNIWGRLSTRVAREMYGGSERAARVGYLTYRLGGLFSLAIAIWLVAFN